MEQLFQQIVVGLSWPDYTEVDWGKYQMAALMVGTNDVGYDRVSVDSQFRQLMQTFSLIAPQITWAICAIPPRPRDFLLTRGIVRDMNSDRRKWCEESFNKYLDTHSIFLNKEGAPKSDCFRDGLHLSNKGMAKFKDFLRQQLADSNMGPFLVWRLQ
jgi:lysophospholipase L1-like esterase